MICGETERSMKFEMIYMPFPVLAFGDTRHLPILLLLKSDYCCIRFGLFEQLTKLQRRRTSSSSTFLFLGANTSRIVSFKRYKSFLILLVNNLILQPG